MHWILLLLLLATVLVGPQLWAKAVLKRHSRTRDDYPGTGGELARHLLDRHGLQHVSVAESQTGDHYDPESKTVCLAPENLSGRSLTAVTVAAHEVGHAIQDASGYRPLHLRGRLVGLAQQIERVGSVAMMALPVVVVATRSPVASVLFFLAALASLGAGAVVHLVTLPVEWDASFRRALPLLERGGYLPARDLPAARRILRACALTYVAASLASLLNVWRWLAILRR